MYACMYVCMYICMHGCTYANMRASVCMPVCGCMYVGMHVCLYAGGTGVKVATRYMCVYSIHIYTNRCKRHIL